MFGFCEAYDGWFIVGAKDSVNVQYCVVHSSSVKCYSFYGWVSIGFVCGVVVRCYFVVVSSCVRWVP